eukprot:10453101-Ditylum_brightwellii.AAC.1
MTYDTIVEAIDRQLTSEAEKTDEECLWIFNKVVGHRKNGQTWDVKMNGKMIQRHRSHLLLFGNQIQ